MDAEFPLSAPWTEVMHPSGHACRASADWLASWARRLPGALGDPWLAAALALSASQSRLGVQACLVHLAMADEFPEALLILGHADRARATGAFMRASTLLREASESWTPPADPALRGWARRGSPTRQARLPEDPDVVDAARKAFSSMARNANTLRADPLGSLLAAALPHVASLEWVSAPECSPSRRSRCGALLRVASRALAAGIEPAPGWRASHAQGALEMAVLSHEPAALQSFATALFPDPALRMPALGAAFARAASDLRAYDDHVLGLFAKFGKDGYDQYVLARRLTPLREVFSRSFGAVCRAQAPNAPDPAFWEGFHGAPWSGPSFAKAFSDLALALGCPSPADASAVLLSMAGSAADLGASLDGSDPRSLPRLAWRAFKASSTHRRSRAPSHLALARALPCPSMEAQCLADCPPEVAADIERGLLGAATPEPDRPGARRPRI